METILKEQLHNANETEGEVPTMSVQEIRNQLAKKKGNTACDPDMSLIGVWKNMVEQGNVFPEKEINELVTPYSWGWVK